jgi:hypothetical protein
MIKSGANPEVVRRQMRHKNISTMLKIYTQVRSEEIEASLPVVPWKQVIGPNDSFLDVIQMKRKA